jgi:ferritin-like metal-binding protein YciE
VQLIVPAVRVVEISRIMDEALRLLGIGPGADDAESRLVGALEQIAVASTCGLLKEAILKHHDEKKDHLLKIEGVFAELGERATRKTSEATIALLYESHEVTSTFGGFPVINAALIASLQKIEHYEIASYGCLRDWAAVLGLPAVADTLQKILDQDKATNRALTELARTRSNREALNEEAIREVLSTTKL